MALVMGFCVQLTTSPEERAEREAAQAKEDALIRARVAVRRYVTSRMKSPATTEVTIRQASYGADGKFRAVGHVDAQNGFGATLRNEWIIELSEKGQDFNVDFFELVE